MCCYYHSNSSNLVDIYPPPAPPFSQCTSQGAPVLCLPGEGSGMAVVPQGQPKKSENFCVSTRGDSHISPPAPPHSTTLRVLSTYLFARCGGIRDVFQFISLCLFYFYSCCFICIHAFPLLLWHAASVVMRILTMPDAPTRRSGCHRGLGKMLRVMRCIGKGGDTTIK